MEMTLSLRRECFMKKSDKKIMVRVEVLVCLVSTGKHTLWSDVISSIDYIDVPDVPFSSLFSKKVSNGFDTMLWKDVWCSEGIRFIDHFPRLYAFESNKDCKISSLPIAVLTPRFVGILRFLISEADEESLDHYLIKCPKIILL
ncbi:hypothetical protein Tco_1268224 [Tanacetum coccineum]